jgi:nucleoside-diphosphate-sugar epimerase
MEIANLVNEITGNDAGVKLVPRRDWDSITKRRASIEKAHRVLGYEPKMKVQDGIKYVYRWIIDNREQIEKNARF